MSERHMAKDVRLIIDSNCLSSTRLREFLESSRSHKAILTDYAWMEAYKSNSIAVFKKSMSVISEYPDQTLHLWGTKRISALDYRGAGLGDMMIRRGVARDFNDLIDVTNALDESSDLPLARITSHVAASKDHIDGRLLEEMRATQQAFPLMEAAFTSEEKRRIRRREPHTAELINKIMFLVGKTSAGLAKRHPDCPRGPSGKSYYNTFLFRYSLANMLYLLEWIREGSDQGKNVSKVRNDMIDLNFATYGTYFNGVMTEDRNLQSYHAGLRVVLDLLRGRMPADFSHL